jgi:hypothetical protein
MQAINELIESHPKVESEIRSGLQQLVAQLDGTCFGAPEASRQERINRENRIGSFDFKTSLPYQCFKDKGWTDMRFNEMTAIGEVLALQTGVHLDREARRTRPVFYKWLEGNWAAFRPHIDFIRRIYDNNLDDPRP